MRLRRAEAGDLAAVGDITVAAYASFTLGPQDPYVEKLRDAAARAEQAELWVAEDDRRLLGSVTWCPKGSVWREIAAPDEGEFRMLAVAPEARGRGVGELLTRKCIDLSRADCDRGMVLSSLPVMVDAHRLYTRLGFTRQPERDWSPVPGVDLVAFVLAH